MDSRRRQTTVAYITGNIIGEMKRQDVQSCDAAEELVESDDFGAFLHSYEEVRASIAEELPVIEILILPDGNLRRSF